MVVGGVKSKIKLSPIFAELGKQVRSTNRCVHANKKLVSKFSFIQVCVGFVRKARLR